MTMTDPTAAAGAAGTGDAGTGAATAAGTATGADDAGAKTLTLTQDQLDAMIARRLAKTERENAPLAEKAKKYDDLLAQQQTEAEKAEAKAKEREAEIAKREASATARLIRAGIIEAVKKAGIDPEFEDLVVEALMRDGSIKVDDEGEVDGIEKALKAMLAAKPKLAAKAAAGRSGSDGFHGKTDKTIDEQIAEAESKKDFKLARVLKLRKYDSGKA